MRRVLLRIVLGDRRFSEPYSAVYNRLLEWPGIPVDDRFELVNLFSLVLFVPRHDNWIIGEIYSDEAYDMFFKPRPGSTIVDVGAHVGAYAVRAARGIGENGHVIAVEPSPVSYALLEHNVEINSLRNVTPLNIALSNLNGVLRLYFHNQLSQASIVEPSEKYVDVKSRRLDDIIGQHTSKQIDIIKIDAEGAEKEILLGALDTLTNSTSRVVIAAYHYPGEIDELSEILRGCGFTTNEHKGMLYAHKKSG